MTPSERSTPVKLLVAPFHSAGTGNPHHPSLTTSHGAPLPIRVPSRTLFLLNNHFLKHSNSPFTDSLLHATASSKLNSEKKKKKKKFLLEEKSIVKMPSAKGKPTDPKLKEKVTEGISNS
jgi:hypothetical protein